ncbi:sortase [Streptomyces sp. Edi2]|uniref:sortase n=1 Tax=Streptomyces sp. Edi2 TaxID=3162528 RepID=UPI003305DD75
MPENTHASDAAEPASSSDAARASRTRRNLLIGASVAAAVAIGLTAVRLNNGPEPVTTATKTTEAASRTTPEQDPLTTTSHPATKEAPDHTGKARDQARKTLHNWSESNPAASDNKHAVSSTPDTGVGGRIHEVLRIPALGATWSQPVYEGVGNQQLQAGVGHFDGTAEPGQLGNFALAGHRSGVASPPFRDIDRIKAGSAIKVTAADRTTYTYTVTRVRVVDPTDVNVVARVPDHPNARPTKKLLTLITCWPANGHSKRVVVEAQFSSSQGGV